MTKDKELLVLDYTKSPSSELRDQIVVSYKSLVEYIARKFAYNREDLPDLIQVGTIGLLKSIGNYNPNREAAFSTFASATIIGEIRHYLRDKTRLVKLPRKLQEQYSKIRTYIKKSHQSLGKFPTVQQIADGLGISEESVLESLEAGKITQVISLDKPMYSSSSSSSSQDETSLLDGLGIEFKDEKMLNKETLKQAIQTLPTREKKIIYLRFYEGLSQKEIAIRVDLSQMHVSRLLTQAISRLRKRLTGL